MSLVCLSFHDRCVQISSPRLLSIYSTSRSQSRKIRYERIILPQKDELLSFSLFFDPPLRISSYFPFPSLSLSLSLEIEFIAEIARLRPTIGVPMPTLSETLRTGPYPPPPQDKFCNVLPNTDPEYVERVSIFLILH